MKSLLSQSNSGDVKPDTSNVNILVNLARELSLSYPDSSLQYAEKALQLAKSIDYTKGALNANYQIGRINFFKGDYQQVFDIANESLREIEIHPSDFTREKALTNQLAGMGHASLGSYQPGLKYFMKAKILFEELDDEKGLFENMNNIGVSYLKLEDYEKALEIFLELDSLQTLESATISIPVNLGFIYYELGEFNKAEEHLNRVLNFKKGTYDRRALGLSTFKLGEIYRARGEYQKAINFFNQSIKVYDELSNDLKKVQALNGIALTYLQRDKPELALKYAERALKISESNNGLPEQNNSAETLFKVHQKLNNAEMALKYHKLFKVFSDSLFNDDISKEIGRLEAENEFEKRELELQELQKQRNLENEKQVAEQRTYLVVVIALLFIAILVAYQFYRSSHIRKESNELLKQKNREIESQADRLKELNEIKNHLFSIISHDLRGPLSSLSGFIDLYEAEALSKEDLNTFMPQIADKFNYTSSLLNNLLSWSKSQLEGYQIKPEKFNAYNLVNDMLRILEPRTSTKNIAIYNRIDDHIRLFADKNMVELILRNLISNAIKFTPEHGKIEINASIENNETTLSIKDNGVGISQEKLKLLLTNNSFYTTNGTNNESGTGLGLMLCKDFIEKNNGTLRAESKEGNGSTFYVTLPAVISQKMVNV